MSHCVSKVATIDILPTYKRACSGAVETRSPHNRKPRVRFQTRCVFRFVKVSRFTYCTRRLANPTSLGVRKSHVCPSIMNPHPGNLPVRFPIDYTDVKQKSESIYLATHPSLSLA